MEYKPPFSINDDIINLLAKTSELVGQVSILHKSSSLKLRRENRIKTIHSSLAIEHNSLSLEQVTAVINGKRILGAPQEIKEVQNAYEAYDIMLTLNPLSIEDLLKAHKLMMNDLVKENGRFRNGGVGIFDGNKLIHTAPPANYVPQLISDLFEWYKQSPLHILIKSFIFHYEFEFIHPFADGNGRTGRLWQSLILQKWKAFFAWLPIETLVHENQEVYYNALQTANNMGESTVFVEFMLEIIRDALREIETQNTNEENATAEQLMDESNVKGSLVVNEERILKLLEQDGHLTANVLASTLGITSRQAQRILAKLKKAGKIVRHGASKNGWWEVR